MEVLTLISGVIATQSKSLFSGIAKDFGEEVKHIISNNILEYQVEEYNRNSFTKTLLHRVQPKSLKEFYQPLFITPFGENKKPNFRISNLPNQKRIPTDSIKVLFRQKKFITLIGNAGSGKSTIVKYLFLNSIDTNFKIPIKVELRYLNDFPGSVIDFVKDRIFKLEKLATNDKIIERLLSSGDFVFFLDGYDEVNSLKKEKVTTEIDDLVKIYNKNYYLLTSRPYTEIDLLPLFHNYQVCELSDEDINQFISKQIPKEEKELCDKIIEAVNSQENHSYKSFLSNPLLLSMFILTFQSYSSIPQKRSEFYNQVFDALFSVHDSMSKLAFVREKQCGLSKEQFIEVLKLFSFISYFDEKFIFSGHYLDEKFKLIKEKKKSITFDNIKLITDLQVAIGILNKEGTDYTFPHRSLQEYFAAIYISSLNDSNKKIIYTKIIQALTEEDKINRVARENFYLLLSELDENGVIQYAIIPFLENYLINLNLDSLDYDEIISKYLSLRSVYDSFYYAIKSNELLNMHEEFDNQFRLYMHENGEFKKGTQKPEDVTKLARKKLAEKDIKPFLESYLPKISLKIQDLSNHIISENKSDTDIIALI